MRRFESGCPRHNTKMKYNTDLPDNFESLTYEEKLTALNKIQAEYIRQERDREIIEEIIKENKMT